MMGHLSLLDELDSGSVGWLEPSFDAETKTVTYSNFEQSEVSDERLPEMLETLATEGVLEKEFVRRAISCPDCESADLDFLLACPKCSSSNTKEIPLLEHTECGCVRSREQFEADSVHICPECDTEIESVEAACEWVETVNQCHECGERSDTLDHLLDCAHCYSYTPEEVYTMLLYRYRFDESQQSWLDSLLTTRDGIVNTLEANEYDVQANVVLPGESDEEHVVDLYATDPIFGVEIVVSVCEPIETGFVDGLKAVAEATETHPVLVTTSGTRNESSVELAVENGIQILQVDEDGNAEPVVQSSGELDRRTAFQNFLLRVMGTDDATTDESS